MKKILFMFLLAANSLANAVMVTPNLNTVTNIYEVNFVTGNNANACTAARPCKTLAGACAKVTQPNSIIYIRKAGGGTLETATCDQAIGVSIRCETQATFIKANAALAPMIRGYSSAQGTDGRQSVSNCTLDGNNRLGSAAAEYKGRSNVVFDGVIVRDWDDHGVDFNGVSTVEFEPGRVDQTASVLAVGNKFINSQCLNSTKFSGFGRGCLQIGSQDGFLVQESIFNEDARGGVGGTTGWNIKYLNGGMLKDLKILHSTFTKEARTGDSFPFNIELTSLTGNSEFAYNTIDGALDVNSIIPSTEGAALDYHDNVVGPSVFNTAICSNTSCSKNGLILEFHIDRVYIRNNIFKNIRNIVIQEFHGAVPMPTLQKEIHLENNLGYNICTAFAQSGMANAQLSKNVGLSFLHNTFTWAGTTDCTGLGGAINLFGDTDIQDVTIRNNIITGFNLAPVHIITNNNKLFDSVTIDNNLFFNNGNSNNPWFNGGAGINGATNYIETNTIKSNPLFVNASGTLLQTLDYKISGSSPARNAGRPLTLPNDLLNWRRTATPSIGAIEYRTGD